MKKYFDRFTRHLCGLSMTIFLLLTILTSSSFGQGLTKEQVNKLKGIDSILININIDDFITYLENYFITTMPSNHQSAYTGGEIDSAINKALTGKYFSNLSAPDGNPDSVVYIDNVGRVGIGTISQLPTAKITMETNTNYPNFSLMNTASGSTSSSVALQLLIKNNTINNNNRLGALHFGAWDAGSNLYRLGTSIEAYSSQGWTFGSAQGSNLRFYATPNNFASRTEAMRIDGNNELWIGSTTDLGDYKLQVTGNAKVTGSAINFSGMPSDSTGLSRGDLWLKVSDGTVHWKY